MSHANEPDALLARSAALGVVARLLRDRSDLAGAAKEIHGTCVQAGELVAACSPGGMVAQLLDGIGEELRHCDLDENYRSVFGHVPAGRFSPYETSYGPTNAFTQSQAMANLGGFYRAFGVSMADEGRERPDHLGAEIEFASLLLYREALALEEGQGEHAEVCRSARRRFFEEHLGRWGPVLLERLERESASALFKRVAQLGRLLLSREGEALGARCPAFELSAPPADGTAEDYCPELFGCPGTIEPDESQP